MNRHHSGWAPPSTSYTIILALVLVCVGCSTHPGGEPKPNQPPIVWLSSAPPEGSVESYTIQLFWGGWDPDGEIEYYEYCITDNEGGSFDPIDTTSTDTWNPWSPVFSNDSTFSFTADVLVDTNTTDLISDFTRNHTFFIRAVDRLGLSSREPAYRSFTAFTLSPIVRISVPRRVGYNPAQVPGITTFRWTATDYISDPLERQDPDSVSYLLEPIAQHNEDWNETIAWIRNLAVDAPEWGDWKWYKAPEDSGKYWTTPPKDIGGYMFAIRAKDEARAITPVFDESANMRRIAVSFKTTGPILTVRNQYMGSVVTAVCNHPLTIMDLPAGIPIEFGWSADASSYGGTEAGYRYGWDITDLSDPEQWEVDFTPFPPTVGEDVPSARSKPRKFFFGTHVFTIEVLDNSGYCSRIEVKINVIQFTMTKPLYIVDDYDETAAAGWNAEGGGIEPNDFEHDDFWVDMVENVEGFDASVDVFDVSQNPGLGVPLTNLADYKSIVWSVRGHVDMQLDYPILKDFIKFRPKEGEIVSGKQQPNLIALFMAAGGHVMLNGQHPVSMSVDKVYAPGGTRYPLMYKYDLDLRQYTQANPPTTTMVEHPPGDESFPYFELCLETIDYAETSFRRRRPAGYYCSVSLDRIIPPELMEYQRTRTMRAAIPLDLNFPRLELRPETAAQGKAHDPAVKGLNVEIYNPEYFFNLCPSVRRSRDCFTAIYGLDCFYTSEPTYGQPVAFWTRTFQDRIAEGVTGAVGAPSVVFGFPPVMFKPADVKVAMEHVFFTVWQLIDKRGLQ